MSVESLLERNDLVDRLMADGAFTAAEANGLLDDADKLSATPWAKLEGFQQHFLKENGDLDMAKVKAFCHIHNSVMTIDSYGPVLDERAHNADKREKLNDLETAIGMLHASGYRAEEIGEIFNTLIRISESSTPHPTESLSLTGTRLARGLVHAAETHEEERQDKLRTAALAILRSDDFAAREKDTILKEMDYSSECARVHNPGVNKLDREIEDIIERITGQKINIKTHTAQCTWAYDADGKNNADGFAMMMQIATTTKDALASVNENLGAAKNSDDTPKHLRKRIETLQEKIDLVLAALKPVYDRSRQITQDLANLAPEKREAKYREYYEDEFENLFRKLSKIYEGVDNKRGLDFFHATVDDLNALRKALSKHNPDGALLVDESYRTVLRCGFALEKGQTRHNDLVYIDMVDNMMKSDAFWSLGILSKTDRDIIEQKGKFSDIPHALQSEYFRKILDYAKENGNRKDILRVLADSNPLSFKPLDAGGNGYPDQEHAYVDRFRLRGLFPYKFEEGIISDSQVNAPQRQKFLADLFGIPHMKHMPLHEDPENLGRQDRLAAIFNREGGIENSQTRKAIIPPNLYQPYQELFFMRPASDAERNGASFTRLQAIDQVRKGTRVSYENQVCLGIMMGGGQSLNRFGGDVSMVRRIVAQTLMEILEEKQQKGIKFDDYDERCLTMAMRVMYTEQGRSRRYYSATPDQKCDDFAGKMTQMIQDYLELKGHVPKGTFIDPKSKFSDQMQPLQRMTAEEAITQAYNFNNVVKFDKDGKPSLVLDALASAACCPSLLPYQNNGARPAGKQAGSKVSALRAIGKDQAMYTMQSFATGFYSTGWAMQRMHERMQKGDITAKDIRDLTDHADWKEAIFSRNLIDAGRFNATYLFDHTPGDKKEAWTFDRAIEVGKSVRLAKIEGKNQWKMHYDSQDGTVSEEQAYLCKIYYDRAVFLGMTEAALKPGKGKNPDPLQASLDDIVKSMRPKDNSLEFGLGEQTRKKFPLVARDLGDQWKNNPMYAVYTLIQTTVDKMKTRGDADPVKSLGGESVMREISSSMRAGTLPHKSKWTGEDTYGVEHRRQVDMKLLLERMLEHKRSLTAGPPASALV